jgi:deoxyribodipyrimidine photolyase-related protein
MPKTLRLILGDQLNYAHSWFEQSHTDILYVLMEIRQETDYAQHHIQKVVAFFEAMRAFATYLRTQGHEVRYLTLDEPQNTQLLTQNLDWLMSEYAIECFEYQLPDEYRLDEQLKNYCQELSITTKVFDSEHFMSSRAELGEFFRGKKMYLMENFYRMMRRKYKLLMDSDDPIQPLTGQWNYDADNRKKLPSSHRPVEPLMFDKDVSAVVQLLENQQVKTIGHIDSKHFIWPTTRQESLRLLDFFVKECLINFGTYEDAMASQYWSIYHSRLSFCMNVKLLSPLEVVERAITEWQNRSTEISIAQIEGFVRQIIGWREYMRGIYWLKMPDYENLNFFENQRKLPEFFWTGKTKMNCMKHSIGQSLNYAYAHHIQRLMVTGNFCSLAGIAPADVDGWYLGIYIDALQWVEITNTRGMSQFADGGIVGSKPYVASANYIDKMSDYCSGCFYDKSKRTGHKACPFNSLYWHFYDRNQALLERNPRIGMMYQTWKKMDAKTKAEILEQANIYLEKIEEL